MDPDISERLDGSQVDPLEQWVAYEALDAGLAYEFRNVSRHVEGRHGVGGRKGTLLICDRRQRDLKFLGKFPPDPGMCLDVLDAGADRWVLI